MANYWDTRTLVHGHTSWSDYPTYQFEKGLKQRWLRDFVREKGPFDSLLDFGCGIGDYTSFLHADVTMAVGYDSSVAAISVARRLHRKSNITFHARLDKSFFESNFELVLFINVLQHMDLQQLVSTFDLIRGLISVKSTIVIINSFPTSSEDHLRYQSKGFYLHEKDEIVSKVESFGLSLIQEDFFWHPDTSNSKSWRMYRYSPLLRALRLQVVRDLRIVRSIEGFLAKFFSSMSEPLQVQESIQKVLVFSKLENTNGPKFDE